MERMFFIRFLLCFVFTLFVIFLSPIVSNGQVIKLDDGSTIKIENPFKVPITEDDIKQIRDTLLEIKGDRAGRYSQGGRDALAIQNYERQLRTELGVEKARRETYKEYDRLERDLTRTQRLKEGRDVIIYRDEPFGRQGRR
ncbi:MAG: hypothetical protein N2745_01365 [Syntrophorhabdaceae bacterium]|nr:hypothetical protein [Syntrophorhabdaceae bacterium]